MTKNSVKEVKVFDANAKKTKMIPEVLAKNKKFMERNKLSIVDAVAEKKLTTAASAANTAQTKPENQN